MDERVARRGSSTSLRSSSPGRSRQFPLSPSNTVHLTIQALISLPVRYSAAIALPVSSRLTLAPFSVSDNYQSNGACSQSCAGYAFAVVQYKSCWCSNYIPADTTSIGSCAVACPGYPYENCGNESSGLFGYVALGKAPLGTQGAGPSSSPTVASPATQATQATQPTSQAVSTQFPLEASSGHPVSPDLASSSSAFSFFSLSHGKNPEPRPSLPFPGPPPLISSTPISFETRILTQPVQNTSPDPSPVTVQDTVTASKSIQVSYVSIVCLHLALFH